MVSVSSSSSSASGSPGDEFCWEDSAGDGEYRVTRCYCGRRLKIRTAWDPENPGRRFLQCPYGEEFSCGFFKWIDPIFPTHAKDVILDLIRTRSNLETVRTDLMKVISDQVSENQRLLVDFEEAKGLAEFISKLDDDKQKQLALAGKEIRSLVVRLKWHKIISSVGVALFSAACLWFMK